MKQLKDNFSANAAGYASYRPRYPQSLFEFLFGQVSECGTAWDCGTGNGQVATMLAQRFRQVYATDISSSQLENALPADNITYAVERAEGSSLPDSSTDLITVAQAFHWFDFDAFFNEVRRVAKPGGLLAIWTYSLLRIDEGKIDEIVNDFYFKTVGPFWDPERRLVDTGYKDVNIPFREIEAPLFNMDYEWNFEQFLGYIRTWSSVRHYTAEKGTDPVSLLSTQLSPYWQTETSRSIAFPVSMRLFRID